MSFMNTLRLMPHQCRVKGSPKESGQLTDQNMVAPGGGQRRLQRNDRYRRSQRGSHQSAADAHWPGVSIIRAEGHRGDAILVTFPSDSRSRGKPVAVMHSAAGPFFPTCRRTSSHLAPRVAASVRALLRLRQAPKRGSNSPATNCEGRAGEPGVANDIRRRERLTDKFQQSRRFVMVRCAAAGDEASRFNLPSRVYVRSGVGTTFAEGAVR